MGTSSTPRIVLSAGRIKPVWAGHPWIYAQAIDRIEGIEPSPGEVVEVVDPKGNHLGRGFWSPDSAIPVRLVTRDPGEALDEDALRGRIEAAAERRHRYGLPSEATDGFRLLHAEGDGLPGLVADRYGSTVVIQLLTVGMARRREVLADALAGLSGIDSVVEVPGGRSQRSEGIEVETRTLRGPEAESLVFRERNLEWDIPVAVGQKTGFFFDQRENRARVEALATDRRVLDAYCYVGGFALAAARGGARSVLGLDRSESVLEIAREAARINGVETATTFETADLRRDLAARADAGEVYDLVVLDPPKLAPRAKDRKRALSALEGMNLAAVRLLAPGGILVTCSCSSAVSPEDLLRTVAVAGARAGRTLRLLELRHQGPDHPTPPAFPEGRYLTCAVLEADG